MKKTAIIIPTRLSAKRFPNKPLANINGLPMIIHVLNRAKESKVGQVFVATPDEEIINIVKKNGGEAILTNKEHLSGSDRVHEAYLAKLKGEIDLIINLQGDMPNIKPDSISKLELLMRKNKSDIGTLASLLREKDEMDDPNVVKVIVEDHIKDDSFLNAKDFFRIKKDLNNIERIYHHIGIYAFTSFALSKYVSFSRSKKEKERNLEQMRAIENNLIIKVGFVDSCPLGIDTKEDLKKITEEMKY
tara:strand:+ start:636 stop:1373 length:738 start_codon:yes stop_codon:yes gene_type:complete